MTDIAGAAQTDSHEVFFHLDEDLFGRLPKEILTGAHLPPGALRAVRQDA